MRLDLFQIIHSRNIPESLSFLWGYLPVFPFSRDKPTCIFQVLFEMRRWGIHLNAVTHGYYNKVETPAADNMPITMKMIVIVYRM
jgi:hypothetical protein